MKISTLTLIIAMGLCTFTAAASDKRGVGENQFSIGPQLNVLSPGVHWYYNWGNVPSKGYGDQVINNESLEFVPMCWNANYNADEIRNYVKSHPSCKYLLGFNEPNFTEQSNMTPAFAAQQWPAMQALAKELGLKLVAPALNYSPNPPYQDPLKWMDEFVAIVGKDAFDYTAIHNYGGLGVMKDLSSQFYEKYGKPVWVTEFCYWPGGAGNVYVAPDVQMRSMVETLCWLEQTDYIHRYAWFKPIGASNDSNKPNYGLLEPTKGITESFLTNLGYAYTYLWDFSKDFYHSTEESFAATDFVNCFGITIAPTKDSECPRPIELAEFKYGAYVDWQVDVPATGEYSLTLSVTGVGEPESFNPYFAVYSVNNDGTEGDCLMEPKQYELPGNFTDYITLNLPVALNAGKQTIRLKDGKQLSPSQVHIASAKFSKDGSGVEGVAVDAVDADNAIYSISGVRVRGNADAEDPFAGLPAGVYIRNGRKFVVR